MILLNKFYFCILNILAAEKCEFKEYYRSEKKKRNKDLKTLFKIKGIRQELEILKKLQRGKKPSKLLKLTN